MSTRNILTTIALLFILVVLPAGSYYYLTAGYSYRKDRISELGEYGKVPDFKFTNQHGTPITLDSVNGNFLVADFFFSRCAGPCPKMARQLQRVEKAFSVRSDVVILSHTVDPEYDNPEILKVYADRLEVGKNWHFLTGPKKGLYEMARKGYKIAADEGDGGPDDFIHSEKLVLVDNKGQIRGYYTGTDSSSVNKLIEHISLMMPIGKKHTVEMKRREEL